MTIFDKFDNDMRTRSRANRLLLSIDQFFNVLIWNGSQDETISSHIRRRIERGEALKVERMICRALQFLESGHCMKSKGE